MAISIAYGIGFATILTLLMLPLFLSFSNSIKVGSYWLVTGNKVNKEEVERAIKEQQVEEHMNESRSFSTNGIHEHQDLDTDQKELEETL